MILSTEAYLAHYGILRKSGRYPWGSGETQSERNRSFLGTVADLKRQGLSEPEIAKGFGLTTTQLRAAKSIAGNAEKHDKIMTAQKLRDKGMGASAIAKQMGINESSVRSLLAPGVKDKTDNLQTIAAVLKDNVDKHGYIDVGAGVESRLGISETKLKTAAAMLEEQGYFKTQVQVPQVGAPGQQTTVRVLAKPGSTYRDVKMNRDKIRQVGEHSEDGGRTFIGAKPPLSVSPKRVKVRYAEEGGDEADGVIYVRPGVDDISLGGSRYAQVRIAVGGTHYLKGMAVYKDDLPPGVDLEFNTNKSNTGNKMDAMKKMATKPDGTPDLDNPFGSQIRRQVLDDKGNVKSSMNILDEEGTWGNWSKTISTQVLSKQPPTLAKQQLDLSYERKKADLEEIKALTNPTVRKKLLEAYADGADSSAVHLKAAHLPRQATHVILPLKSLKENQVYAPNYRDGETVALIRYPHGGKFEIPELVVNNKNREGQKSLGKQAPDAIGINSKVAARLSGADFDGDTVVVIPNNPNNPNRIRTEPGLKALKGFDPQRQYKAYDGMKTIDGGTYDAATKSVKYPEGKGPNSRAKGTQMGLVSNLITDMTIKGASNDELARAVKHSMVVIDAEKHALDHRRSKQENGIHALTKKYQGDRAGSSTLISRATSPVTVDKMKPRSAKDGGPIDPKTGKLMFVPDTYVDRNGNTVSKKIKVDKLANTDDAFTLVSKPGTQIEAVYAEHSNRLKGLANEARREVAAFKPPLQNKSAKTAFKPEVDTLLAKLNVARRNKPLERQAQIFANAIVQQKMDANPLMDPADLKKIKTQALATARARTGASKTKIVPSPQEWAAIQAGAVSQNQLKQILDNADLDAIRALATPRSQTLMTSTKTQRAKSMAKAGYTQAEIADALGVSTSTLRTVISD